MNHGFIGFGNLAKAIYKGLKTETSNNFSYISKTNKHKEIKSYETYSDLVKNSEIISD